MATGLRFSPKAKIVTVAIVVALAVLFLVAIRDMLRPFIWAAIIAYIFNPLVTAISRRARIHRFWAVALLYAIGAGLMVWIVMYVAPPLRREAEQLRQDFPSLLTGLMEYLMGNDSINIFGFQIDSQTVVVELANSADRIGSYIGGHAVPVVFGAFGLLTRLLMLLLATFYLMVESDGIGAFIRRAIPPAARDEIVELGASIDRMLGRWVRGQVMLVLIMGSVTWIALTVLGVRYAIILAMLDSPPKS